MKIYGITMPEGAEINNTVVARGAEFPNGEPGELFFKTGTTPGIYIYTGFGWEKINAGNLNIPASETVLIESGKITSNVLEIRKSGGLNFNLYGNYIIKLKNIKFSNITSNTTNAMLRFIQNGVTLSSNLYQNDFTAITGTNRVNVVSALSTSAAIFNPLNIQYVSNTVKYPKVDLIISANDNSLSLAGNSIASKTYKSGLSQNASSYELTSTDITNIGFVIYLSSAGFFSAGSYEIYGAPLL
jgi:hypothetical protein